MIEVLVIISIIGILTSIIVVSVNDARLKARIGAGLQFDANIKHGLGADIVGEWSFDENGDNTCQGATFPYDDICDSSGNNNHGQRVGATWTSEGNTPSKKGYALSFNGTSSYVDVLNNAALQFTSTQSFTVTAWAYVPSLPSAWKGIVTKSRNSSPWYGIWINSSNRWVFGGPSNILGSIVAVGWQYVVATQDAANNKRILYVNGVQVGTGIAQGANGSGNLRIGNAAVGEFFNGLIDEVRIYSQSLNSAQIQQYYADGAKKRGLLAEK